MLEHFEEEIEIQTSEVNVKSKKYLIITAYDPNFSRQSVQKIKDKKNEALEELTEDLKGTNGDFDKIYQIFLSIKTTERGILRYRRDHLLPNQYGDTNSYKSAINKILIAIKDYTLKSPNNTLSLGDLKPKLKSYQQYEQLTELLQEVARLFSDHYHDTYLPFIRGAKRQAVDLFKAELEQQSTLADVLKYYNYAKVPYNILRIHTENLFKQEGNTSTYKEALYAIAKKAMTFKQITSQHEKIMLTQLLKELEENRLAFDQDKRSIISNFNTFINGVASGNIGNSVSAPSNTI